MITAGLGVVNPVLIRVVFDNALFPEAGGPDMRLLWTLAGVMAGITVITGSLGIVQTYLTNMVGQRVMRDLRDTLYRHLQGLSLSFFTDTRTGEIQSRVADDVGGVQRVVTNTVSDVLSNSVILISTLIAMLVLSWELTIVAVGTAPVFFWLSRFVGAKRRAIAAEAQRSTAELTAITQETLSISGVMLAKLFGRQNSEIDRFHHQNQKLSRLDTPPADDRSILLHSDADILFRLTRCHISPGRIPAGRWRRETRYRPVQLLPLLPCRVAFIFR